MKWFDIKGNAAPVPINNDHLCHGLQVGIAALQQLYHLQGNPSQEINVIRKGTNAVGLLEILGLGPLHQPSNVGKGIGNGFGPHNALKNGLRGVGFGSRGH